MTQTPSSGAGATPGTGTPATGTPASTGATPGQATLTHEEALKRIAELELHAQNKTEEASRHGAKLTATEKELAAYKAAEASAQAAQMSELEKAQKQAADLQEQHDTMAVELLEARVHQEVGKLASTMNFVLPVDILARLLLTDSEAIEFDDNAKPTNIEKLLEKLAKATPDLVKTEQQQQQQRGAPALPAMSPGRSSIQAPGTTTPGKKPSWSDVKWSGQ